MSAIFLIWLIVVVVVPVIAFLLFLWKRKGTTRRFAVESVVTAVAIACILFFGPRPGYDVGRDTIHAFYDGRFQIWEDGDVGYVFSDKASGSLQNNDIRGVLKWAEANDGCYLVTKDGRYHFVDSRTGMREAYQEFNGIPPVHRETFRKMRFWGPYGQLWEDVSHMGWRYMAIVLVLLAYMVRVLMILISPRRRDMNEKGAVK